MCKYQGYPIVLLHFLPQNLVRKRKSCERCELFHAQLQHISLRKIQQQKEHWIVCVLTSRSFLKYLFS